MEVLTGAAAVRRRPGMYIDSLDGDGMLEIVLLLIDLGCVRRPAGPLRVGLTVDADGAITVEDDAPGIPELRTGDERTLAELLAGPGAAIFENEALFIAGALAERLDVTTIRDGHESHVVVSRGEIVEPITSGPTTRPQGTRVGFRPDPTLFRHGWISRVRLAQRLEDLAFLRPEIQLHWSVAGDVQAARGLVGRVAVVADCALDRVVHRRAQLETSRGPLDLELALACLPVRLYVPSTIDSFVNGERTDKHGSHVGGLRLGIDRFFGRYRAHKAYFTVAMAVQMARPRYYGGTKAQLRLREITEPIAAHVQEVLADWAARFPADDAEMRAGPMRWREPVDEQGADEEGSDEEDDDSESPSEDT